MKITKRLNYLIFLTSILLLLLVAGLPDSKYIQGKIIDTRNAELSPEVKPNEATAPEQCSNTDKSKSATHKAQTIVDKDRCCICTYMEVLECDIFNDATWEEDIKICEYCDLPEGTEDNQELTAEAACNGVLINGISDCQWDPNLQKCTGRFISDCLYREAGCTEDKTITFPYDPHFPEDTVAIIDDFLGEQECKSVDFFYSGHGRGCDNLFTNIIACVEAGQSDSFDFYEYSCKTFTDIAELDRYLKELQQLLREKDNCDTSVSVTAEQTLCSADNLSTLHVTVTCDNITYDAIPCDKLGFPGYFENDNRRFCTSGAVGDIVLCSDGKEPPAFQKKRCCPTLCESGLSSYEDITFGENKCPNAIEETGTCKGTLDSVQQCLDKASEKCWSVNPQSQRIPLEFKEGELEEKTSECGEDFYEIPYTCYSCEDKDSNGTCDVCEAKTKEAPGEFK